MHHEIKTETERVFHPVLEPVLFVNIKAVAVSQSKMSKIMPVLNIIATQYKYDYSKQIDYICGKRVLINCVINN